MLTTPVLIIIIAAVLGSAGLVATLGALFVRLGRIEQHGGRLPPELVAEIERLGEELEALHARVGALDERVEFAEQLLEDPGRNDAIGSGSDRAVGPGSDDG